MESNEALVDSLVGQGLIHTDRVEAAFRAVDRKRFVPEPLQEQAYADTPLPISDAATISAPHMVAINTELLDASPESRIVEIGSGSGYQLAILAELTGEPVVGVELVEELVTRSRGVLQPWHNASVVHGSGLDAVEGLFDRILYSCAIDTISHGIARLVDDGILVAPVAEDHTQVLKKYAAGRVTEHGHVQFVDYQD